MNQDNRPHLDNNNFLRRYSYLNLLIILPAFLLFYFFHINKNEKVQDIENEDE